MKIAIVGNGMIVKEALLALSFIPEIEVTALCCREASKNNGKELTTQYNIPHLYTDYNQMLEKETETNFIYIGIVNSLHFIYCHKALIAGKNIVVEKPICSSIKETELLIRSAKEKHLYIFEAVTFLHSPFFETIKNTVTQLGTLRLIQCNYSKYSSRYNRYLQGDIAPVFNPIYQGGALLDLNIYNLNFVVALCGMPQTLSYHANHGANGIDLSGVVTMKYQDLVAECCAAKDSYSPCFNIVQGEKGYLAIYGSPDHTQQLECEIEGEITRCNLTQGKHRMIDEFKTFEKIYREKDYSKMLYFLEISRQVMNIISKARAYESIK